MKVIESKIKPLDPNRKLTNEEVNSILNSEFREAYSQDELRSIINFIEDPAIKFIAEKLLLGDEK